ncbi:MAG: peptidoglycan DD-metalloendopeptidase family protein [Butyrivibrio sp.]|nr:peptidoglycan DD-metalloendopeptidase family protein [Butyrivibrio sp.]
MNLRDTVFKKKIKIWFLESTVIIIFLWILFMPNMTNYQKNENNYFTIKINGQEVGKVGSRNDAYEAYRYARRAIAKGNDDLTLTMADLSIEGESKMWGVVESPEKIAAKMAAVLNQSKIDSIQKTYSVKINKFSLNLASIDEVKNLLERVISMYDEKDMFDVNLELDSTREVYVLMPKVQSKEEIQEEEGTLKPLLSNIGVNKVIRDAADAADIKSDYKDFNDFKYGLVKIDFNDKIEIVESYLPSYKLANPDTAFTDLTGDKEKEETYEVQTGDSLYSIAVHHNLTVDQLVEMNPDKLQDAASTIRDHDNLTVVVPRHELSVRYVMEELRKHESYQAPISKITNKKWFTTEQKVVQEAVPGVRDAVLLTTYVDNRVEGTPEVEKVVKTKEAVPKVIEIGTIEPPSYIKPISGGRLSSGFGPRKRPTKGASTVHKGVDWATPVGTTVVASAAGTVTRAGWGSGYGYCVYIKHNDGRETRYGHLSKVACSVGQKVNQGDKIALSGNTGVSSGPHVHFEIRVNDKPVNPLEYIN